MRTSIIRPGLIVALRSTLRGGVSYTKTTLEAEHMEGAAAVAKWETTRQIEDAQEHAAAVVARGAARSAITRVCCASSFGLLCPESKEAELSDAIDQARAIAAAHNAGARLTAVDLYVITGRVAQDDAEAARAIGAEVRELLAAMEAGITAADPDAIREAANKARALSGMLSDNAQRKVSAAIAEVRAIARQLVKQVGESGEQAAALVQDLKLDALAAARFAVLDLDDQADDTERMAPVGRAVDFEPERQMFAAPDVAPTLDLF